MPARITVCPVDDNAYTVSIRSLVSDQEEPTRVETRVNEKGELEIFFY